MLCVRLDSVHPDAASLGRAADVLHQGGIVAYPTDTFYGLAANPSNQQAVEQLYRIKGRAVDQSIPLIAADRDQVEAVAGSLSDMAARLADHFWPGPLTLVIPVWRGLSFAVHQGRATVAVRVPAHRVAREFSRVFGAPLTSTSANRTGKQAPTTADGVEQDFGQSIALLLDGGATEGGQPSTIVDVTGQRPVLIRAGAVSWERVLECLR